MMDNIFIVIMVCFLVEYLVHVLHVLYYITPILHFTKYVHENKIDRVSSNLLQFVRKQTHTVVDLLPPKQKKTNKKTPRFCPF